MAHAPHSMTVSHWHNLDLPPGALREPGPDDSRLILWLPTKRDGRIQSWLRIATVARAKISRHENLCAVPATALFCRQLIRGFLSRLFCRTTRQRLWLLPNGQTAEQCGEMQTDLLLVWSEDNHSPIDEACLRSCWPQCQSLQRLGPNLWLVWGVPQSATATEAIPPESCLKQAEQRLAVMRKAGDRPGEVTALTDLGIADYNRGDITQALAHFEQALALARALGDMARESDVLGNLALAALAAGQPGRAQQCLEQELAYVRSAGNRFAEKLALERLGTVQASRGNLTTSIALLNEALLLARTLGDHQHEADLLWHLAIRHAEAGQRDQALAQAQAAVELLQQLGKPQARIYAEHLQRYRQGERDARLTGSGEVGPSGSSDWSPGVALVTTVTTAPLVAEPVALSASPSLLRKALSAAKALTEFVGSGLKTVSAEVRQKRLRVCVSCPHFTGLRCRVCGCFTSTKARLPHEDCPLGQWTVPAGVNSHLHGDDLVGMP